MKESSGWKFASGSGPLAARIRQRKQPVQDRSRATVEAILGATLQVLLSCGATGLTTTRVAERAGVSIGTLYQYFPDKASLVTALKVQYVERLVERVTGAARAAAGLPLAAALRTVISAVLAAKRENLELTLAVREPAAGLGGELLLRDATRRLVKEVQRVLELALPELSDAAGAARILSSAVEGVIDATLHEHPAALQRPALEEELVALTLGYVRERQRASAGQAPTPDTYGW